MDAFSVLKRLCATPAAQACHKYLPHATCPAPIGITKAVEVAAGLALPKGASVTVSKED